MKKIIVAVLMTVFIPINYAGSQDNQTVYTVNVEASMPSDGYLPQPAKDKYYYYKEGMTKETQKADFLNCIEGQRRIISYGRMRASNDKTKPYQGYNSNAWVILQCMKNKGYVETRHKIFEYPYPDYH